MWTVRPPAPSPAGRPAAVRRGPAGVEGDGVKEAEEGGSSARVIEIAGLESAEAVIEVSGLSEAIVDCELRRKKG